MLIGINVLSLRSSLAFAPYLAKGYLEFISNRAVTPIVPRQGGKSFVVRSDGNLILRHEHRQESLSSEDVKHYAATNKMRSQIYSILRMADEVVLASVGRELLLSHPQSEIWLSQETVSALVKTFGSDASDIESSIPDWLKVSMGGGRLLLSDQRSGRWVLLGADHLSELRDRVAQLGTESTPLQFQSPPVINLKGITVHLQSVIKLISILEDFSAGREVIAFDETTPNYSLKVSRSTNGLELSDDDNNTVLNLRETRKWIDLVQAEIEALHVSEIERGRIRTVFASDNNGRWILQWGDEVFVPGNASLLSFELAGSAGASRELTLERIDEFLVVMSYSTGNCVALTEFEASAV